MGREFKLIISGDARGGEAAIQALQRAGAQATSLLEREFDQLGVKSSLVFENQRRAAEAAYQRIKTSGIATADELERAQRAHSVAMARIDEEQFGRREGMLQKLKANWVATAATVAAAWAVASKAVDLAERGAAFQAQGTGFANLAASYGRSADQIVADLQRVSNGTLSVQQTVEQAGKAMVLGVGADYLPKLMEMARASARITGETTQKAFNDLIEGVAKGSAELLNNLGIIVRAEDAYKKFAAAHNLATDALTAEQKQQAILNEVLAKGNDIVERAGKLGESEAEKLAKFSASIDNIGKSIGILLSGPMSELAAEMSATVGWLEAYRSGQIGFWEWAFTGADEAAERLKALRQTNLDALVTPEGQEIARRKAEETARKAAEEARQAEEAARKIRQEEASKKAAAEAVEREKRLKEIQQHNDRILEVEKKRVAQSRQLEASHLQATVSAYEEAVRSMDSLLDARKAVRSQLSARDSADQSRNSGQKDGLNTYLDQQEEIRRAERSLAEAFGMSAEEKAKAYADLIDKAAGYNQAVLDGETEIISALQAESDYQTNKERLQKAINLLFEEEGEKRTAAAESFAEQMIAAQDKVKAFEEQMVALETLLDRMNHKEVNIIFKAQGVEQLLQAGGASGAAAPVVASADPNAPFGAYAVGTRYVPRTGLYQLHRGEVVQNRIEAAQGGGTTVNLGGIQVTVGDTGGLSPRQVGEEIGEAAARKLYARFREFDQRRRA